MSHAGVLTQVTAKPAHAAGIDNVVTPHLQKQPGRLDAFPEAEDRANGRPVLTVSVRRAAALQGGAQMIGGNARQGEQLHGVCDGVKRVPALASAVFGPKRCRETEGFRRREDDVAPGDRGQEKMVQDGLRLLQPGGLLGGERHGCTYFSDQAGRPVPMVGATPTPTGRKPPRPSTGRPPDQDQSTSVRQRG
jgi:hypothetical protein